ncbi:MAG: phosphodiesterase [Bacillota bacterium]
MKVFFCSDIHGSLYYAKKAFEAFIKEQADSMVILGDLYYHGPRNPFPKDYNPMELSKLINDNKSFITIIKGNCDSEVDEMITDIPFNAELLLLINGKKVMCQHGHRYNIDNIPNGCDMLIYGHFHTGFITEKNGVIVANAGSTSLPKENTAHSYLVMDDECLTLKSLDGEIIKNMYFK